jgi:hypothetical protein
MRDFLARAWTFGRPVGRRPARRPALAPELLESRDLLSVMSPTYTLLRPGGAAAPLSSPGPTGTTPAKIRHAYGFDQITFAGGTVAGNGSGTTIAIVDAYDDPNIANDLHQFDLAFGLPDPTFTKVNENGGSSLPSPNGGWIGEIALDVEWAHAIAPGANILLVEANSPNDGDLFQAVRTAANYPGVVAVSMSWAGGEFSGETADDANFVTPSGHGGVTFVASSGDSGAPPVYPSASPNVLAVGGTTLFTDSSGNINGESAWSGSGGGISAYESQPTYQQGVVTQSTTRRTTPDVAYDANPSTGFPVYDSYNNPVSAPWVQYGGTSDAAPQWAALIAIADQGRALANLPSLVGRSQTLATLYASAGTAFHDITSGSSTGSPGEPAGPGYDLATGLGSPIANTVVGSLVNYGNAAAWGGWSSLGSSFRSVTTGTNADGTTEAFAIGLDNALYTRVESTSGTWGAWTSLGGGCQGQIALARNSAGYLDVFVIGQDSQVWYRDQTSPGTFAGWAGLGGSASALAAGTNANGTEQVFIVSRSDNTMNTRYQTSVGGSWASWLGLGGGCKPQLATAVNSTGFLDAFVVGQDSQIWYRSETAAGTFAGWSGLGGDARSLAAGNNANGTEQVFIVSAADNTLETRYQTSVGGPWASLESLGGGCAGPLAVGLNASGLLDVYVIGLDGQVWYRKQTAAGVFSGWAGLGGFGSALNVVTTPNGEVTIGLGLDDSLWSHS